jgi:hypothetical protein
MIDADAVARLLVVLAVPQAAGLLMMRLIRRASWLAWPVTAIAVFGVIWRVWTWEGTAGSHRRCGTALLGLDLAMGALLVVHLGVGMLFGAIEQKARRSSSHRS